MARAFATELTLVEDCEDQTGWAGFTHSGGGAGADSLLTNPPPPEGTNFIGGTVSGNNASKGIRYDNGATIDMTGKLLVMWVRAEQTYTLQTKSAGGVYLMLSGSNENNWAEWWVDGTDTYDGGWKRYILDCSGSPSDTGGTFDITAVQHFGAGVTLNAAPGTILSDNILISDISYGSPANVGYYVYGGGSGSPTSWEDLYQEDLSSGYGFLTKSKGVYFLASRVVFGKSTGSPVAGSPTYFTDNAGTQVVFEKRDYTLLSGSPRDCFNYNDFYEILLEGSPNAQTYVNIGNIVGTGDNRQGVQGGGIRTEDSSVTWSWDSQTNATGIAECKIYGLDMGGATGGVKLQGSPLNNKIISCGFINCGEIDPGTTANGAEILNVAVIDPTDINGSPNYGMIFNQNHNTKSVSFITSQVPSRQYMTHLDDGSPSYGITFDAIKFFGTYPATSGSPIYHGITTGAGSPTITISATNDADPLAAKFQTDSGEVSVTQSATLSIEGVWKGSEIRLYETGTITEVAGIENSGSPQVAGYASDGTFNAGSNQFNSTAYSFISTDVGNQIEITSGLMNGNIYKITAVGSPGSPYATVSPAFIGSPGSPAISWSRIDPTFDYTYNAAAAVNVDIVVHNLNYDYYRITNYDLPSSNSSLLVEQQADRYYSNP